MKKRRAAILTGVIPTDRFSVCGKFKLECFLTIEVGLGEKG